MEAKQHQATRAVQMGRAVAEERTKFAYDRGVSRTTFIQDLSSYCTFTSSNSGQMTCEAPCRQNFVISSWRATQLGLHRQSNGSERLGHDCLG